jgi:triosephosphate isomerase
MNGLREDARALAAGVADQRRKAGDIACDVALCPSAHLLIEVGLIIDGSGVALGAQDCAPASSGAYTGDISAEMIADCGAEYIIVGHSERRADHAEDDAKVFAKTLAAWRAGCRAIICIGETAAERDAGDHLKVVERQLAGSVPDGATAANTVIAYEPVWAIGTGRTPTTDDIAEVHDRIRDLLKSRFGAEGEGMRLLYGGSMKAENAGAIMAVANVNGGLIGGAALKPETFWPIIEAALA